MLFGEGSTNSAAESNTLEHVDLSSFWRILLGSTSVFGISVSVKLLIVNMMKKETKDNQKKEKKTNLWIDL